MQRSIFIFVCAIYLFITTVICLLLYNPIAFADKFIIPQQRHHIYKPKFFSFHKPKNHIIRSKFINLQKYPMMIKAYCPIVTYDGDHNLVFSTEQIEVQPSQVILYPNEKVIFKILFPITKKDSSTLACLILQPYPLQRQLHDNQSVSLFVAKSGGFLLASTITHSKYEPELKITENDNGTVTIENTSPLIVKAKAKFITGGGDNDDFTILAETAIWLEGGHKICLDIASYSMGIIIDIVGSSKMFGKRFKR